MSEIDPDGALLLVAAVARQWIADAPQELPAVANWLGLHPDELRRRMNWTPRRPPRPDWPTCPACGAPLPPRKDGARGGRKRIWCSDRCGRRGTKRNGRTHGR